MCGRCTTASYDRRSWSSCRSQSPVDPMDDLCEEEIDAPQVHAEKHGRQDDDDGRRLNFLPARPGDTRRFVAHLGEEAARAPPPAGHAVAGTVADRILVVVIGHRHNCLYVRTDAVWLSVSGYQFPVSRTSNLTRDWEPETGNWSLQLAGQ